jgi:hypothetical protein
MDTKELAYFVYHKDKFFNSKGKIYLDSRKQLENIVFSLEKGENLFKLIPKLKKSDFRWQSFSYGYFQVSYAKFGEGNSLPDETFHSVGKILVPYYNTIKKDKLIKKSKDIDSFNFGKEQDLKAVDKNYDSDVFFKLGNNYFCLERDNVLVLTKNQL